MRTLKNSKEYYICVCIDHRRVLPSFSCSSFGAYTSGAHAQERETRPAAGFLLLRRVVAHPVSAEPTGFAPVAAEAAVVGVVEHVDAPAAAAHLPEPAPPPAPPAVEEVHPQVHAQPPAAVRPGASPRPTAHPRHLVARLEPPPAAESVVASEPRWRVLVPVLGGHGKRMRRGHGHGHGQCNGEHEASHPRASRVNEDGRRGAG
ncbi:hypothetical protein BHM03_00042857 [Ensete ventricosum]|nr:hypothetical protein BHM03_00042857 [Ensete ventricosum]